MTPSERDNLSRWDGQRRGFYEVWYLKLNDAAERAALWLRYTLRVPDDPARAAEASLWGIFFDAADPARTVALKHTTSLAEASFSREDPFFVRIGDAELRHDRARGALSGEAGTLRWDLSWVPPYESVRPFPYAGMYEGAFPKSKFLSPAFDAGFSGSVEVNDRVWVMAGAPGQQAHIWGVKHADAWTWAHCNAFDDAPGVSFEGLSARIRTGPVLAPPLTLLRFVWDGREHLFNSPADLLWRNRSETAIGRWEFRATAGDLRFAGEVSAPVDGMVGVGYQDPDGERLVCHNSKLGSAHIQVLRRQGGQWRPVDRLRCDGQVALEHVARQGDPRVPVRI